MKTVTAETKREIIDSVTSGKLSVQTAAIRYQVPEALIQVWVGNPDAIKPKVVPHPSTQTQPINDPHEPAVIPDIPHVRLRRLQPHQKPRRAVCQVVTS